MFLISISLLRNEKLLLISDRMQMVDKIAKIFTKSLEMIEPRRLLGDV